ncbi:hypothetical protein DPMN_065414 [Dreissena polymorpha]|uniref:Sushi domain-containing protein n=2 Tax=Dreissena polymorpha TaxID=45954 RepID=A0A9D3YRM5_DREPO|nr:hypothetical protein DPMN_065414 [Dreissena polymorpha]
MRKDLSCHVVLKFLRTTDVTTCMRDCTDDCHGLLFNELERNCTLCASVKIETGNSDKKATAFEKVKKKCGDQTPSVSTETSQKLCPPFENKKNGKVVGESLLEGATKNLTCHPGYSPRDRNNVVSQCKNSQWTKITECAIVCPTFENINNGKVEGDTLFEGATRNLTCNPGYSPRDRNAVLSLCQNGQWTKITECIKDCPPFENNSKGNVTGDSLFEGATRNLTCNTGYSPRDDNIVVSRCQNGHWTNITECVKDCPPFENNSKGNVTGDSLFEGATRNLTCDTGYSPRDDNIVVSRCQNGHWTNISECVKAHNVAVGKNSKQTDTANGRAAACGNDGNMSTCTETTSSDASWEVDLGGVFQIESVIVRGNEEGQWISRVLTFSSVYSPSSWSAQQIIGVANVFPVYGDEIQAWAPKDIDANQFLEFEFPNKVNVSKIDIYETYHAGGVKAVKCYDVTGTWITLWSTAQVSVIKHSRIFSPSFTSTTTCFSNHIRLDIDCSQANSWVEIDAVMLHGYKDVEVYLGLSDGVYSLEGFCNWILDGDCEVQVSGENLVQFVQVKMRPSEAPLQLCEVLVLGF